MKIALLGYGKMGRLVETVALREGWEIGPKLDLDDNLSGRGITPDAMNGVDVAIDFSRPQAVLPNIEACSRVRVNIVVGTTGWGAERNRAEQLVRESGIGMVHGPNFSVGMNVFFEIVSRAAQVIGKTARYDAFLLEQHHRAKVDAPSGTALSLLEIMGPFLKDPNLSVASTRAGFIPGNHIVGFDSEADSIILEHRARNRQGFAEGAVLAARWIKGKKGFYEFRDIFREVLGMMDATR
jgi:4-hydroxy-tetrahydrodipicolinate reductase